MYGYCVCHKIQGLQAKILCAALQYPQSQANMRVVQLQHHCSRIRGGPTLHHQPYMLKANHMNLRHFNSGPRKAIPRADEGIDNDTNCT